MLVRLYPTCHMSDLDARPSCSLILIGWALLITYHSTNYESMTEHPTYRCKVNLAGSNTIMVTGLWSYLKLHLLFESHSIQSVDFGLDTYVDQSCQFFESPYFNSYFYTRIPCWNSNTFWKRMKENLKYCSSMNSEMSRLVALILW